MATVTITIDDVACNDIDGPSRGVTVEVGFDPMIEKDTDPTPAQLFAVRALQAMEDLQKGAMAEARLQSTKPAPGECHGHGRNHAHR